LDYLRQPASASATPATAASYSSYLGASASAAPSIYGSSSVFGIGGMSSGITGLGIGGSGGGMAGLSSSSNRYGAGGGFASNSYASATPHVDAMLASFTKPAPLQSPPLSSLFAPYGSGNGNVSGIGSTSGQGYGSVKSTGNAVTAVRVSSGFSFNSSWCESFLNTFSHGMGS
jgi:hypothetical protein